MSKHNIMITVTGVDRLDKLLMERLGNSVKFILYETGRTYADVIVEELLLDMEMLDR